ncbi:MAG: ABC transporter permease, partial [Acholeplasma sp.]|nr:ABC transporter permease [Acholeplasma sp.]
MIKLIKHLKVKEYFLVLISIVFIVSQVYLDLKLPDYMLEVTKLVQTPGSNIKDIWIQGGYMMLCAFGSLSSAVIVGFIMARIAATFAQSLRSSMYQKIDSFSTNEINSFSTASLITRTTNDVSQVQMFITMGMQLLIKAPILAVWAVIKIANKGFEWSMATAITIVILLTMVLIVMFFVVPKFKKVQKMMDELTVATRENLNGIRVIRAYNAEEYQENKFKTANDNLTKVNLFTSRSMSMLNPLMTFFMSLLSVSIYVIGAYLINDLPNLLEKQALFGNMIVFGQYAMQVIMAFIMLVMIFVILPRTMVSAKRINEVLDTISSIQDGSITSSNKKVQGEIEFKNVY